MKRAFNNMLLLAITATVFSCKKDKIPISDSIVGTWELSGDVNGFSGRVTVHTPGNDTLVIFTADGKYSHYDHSTLSVSGTYTVKLDTNSVDHTVKNRIIFNGNADLREFFEISNNQLSLYLDPTQVSDAGGVGYRRIK